MAERKSSNKRVPQPEAEINPQPGIGKHRMPINVFDSPEGRRVGQTFDSPTVYLDHWGIRLFSDDRRMQNRFVAALKGKRGTLLLSHISTAELGGASDPQDVVDAERFLERCLPQMFLT
ncbi:MAG TPA: hypothetical protein VHW69_09060 [Rhizomicrobium sp.]|nr:hypothetical protein [Rhizomicrobium sp.]